MVTQEKLSLSVAEAARLTGAKPRAIRRQLARGNLRAHRVDRRWYVDPAGVRAIYGFGQPAALERDPDLERFVADILAKS